MPDHVSAPLRNSIPESLRSFIESLEADREQIGQDRARKAAKDPEANLTFYDKRLRDLDIRLEVAQYVADAYGLLDQARDATRGQSDAGTRVELTELLQRIDKHFAKKA